MNVVANLVAHDPGRVDEAPVGGTRDTVVGPPLLPVPGHQAHQAQQGAQPQHGKDFLALLGP